MTPKHFLEVNLREIKALEITCSNCHSTFILPVPKTDLAANAACMACNKQLWAGEQDKTFQRLRNVLIAISQWHNSDAGTVEIGFSVDAV